jgi:hypothetical protein
MTKPVVVAWAAILLFQGCATEWRTDTPARPISYELPAYRAERAVGNLRRLAILPVRTIPVGHFGVPVSGSPDKPAAFGKQLGESAGTYLASEKGYETVAVEGDTGAWRPGIIVHPEHGSIEALMAAWKVARTDVETEAAIKRIGGALDVDGVVAIWIEYSTVTPGDSAENIGWAVLNLFLANAPLFYDMSHTYAEAVIFETASGRPVWRQQLSGHAFVWNSGTPLSERLFFENLENAIPALLIR